MGITVTAIRRPIFICMFIFALIVFGVMGTKNMSKELIPSIDIPYVVVQVVYNGAGPTEVETQINRVLEQNLAGIENLKQISSIAQDGVGIVICEFVLGTDLAAASADVRDKVSIARGQLPDDVNEPIVRKVDLNSKPIMNITVRGKLSPKELRIYADNVLKDEIATVSGVSQVSVNGGEEREVRIDVDKNRLAAYSTNINSIANAVASATLNLPGGKIREGELSYSVRTLGEFVTIDDIKDVMVAVPGKTGEYFRLRDVADIYDSVKEPDTYTRVDGVNAVLLSVQKTTDGNTVAVVDGVKKKLASVNASLPSSMEVVSLTDDAKEVETSIFEVNKTLYEAIFIVVIIVMLFLHSIRGTFIVAIAIPTSLMATYGPISAMGFSLNIMTLLALSLVIGILVDDSIVVLENIERHVKKGEGVVDAAINGRSEIGFAALAISLVDIVVFLPVAFMGGIVGQFFRQFGVTIAIAVAFSLLMSFTLTPMLASKWLKPHKEERDEIEALRAKAETGSLTSWERISFVFNHMMDKIADFIHWLTDVYQGVLEWTLQNKFTTLLIGFSTLIVVCMLPTGLLNLSHGVMGVLTSPRFIVIILLAVMAVIAVATQKDKLTPVFFISALILILLVINLPLKIAFFTNGDDGKFSVTIRMPEGTSLDKTDAVTKQIESVIKKIPEMQTKKVEYREFLIYDPRSWFSKKTQELEPHYITIVGSTSTSSISSGGSGDNYSAISVYAYEKMFRNRTTQDIVDSLNSEFAKIAGPISIIVTTGSSGGPSSGSNGVAYKVSGQDLDKLQIWANKISNIMKGTEGLTDVDISYKPGVPEKQVIVRRDKIAETGTSLSDVAAAVRTANTGNTNTQFRDEGYEYDINVRYKKSDRDNVSDIKDFIVSTINGKPVYVKDIADIADGFAPNKIDRENRERKIDISSNMMNGFSLGNVQQVTDAEIKKLNPPSDVTISTSGNSDSMTENAAYMIQALSLAVILVYMLMCALFESLLTPFVIMFSLPQAMAGALLALFLTGTELSVFSMIGFIMLIGLVTKNAILLCDVTNTLRSKGLTKHEALMQAGRARLRPILMTTIAMIGGMTPIALSQAEGSEMRSPLAIAVIGGLSLSMFLTLLIIPVMYDIVDALWHMVLNIPFLKGLKKATIEKEDEWLASRTDDFDPTDIA